MATTNKERCRRYWDKVYADPVRYAAHLEAARIRQRKGREVRTYTQWTTAELKQLIADKKDLTWEEMATKWGRKAGTLQAIVKRYKGLLANDQAAAA